jgi:hypothetical protein
MANGKQASTKRVDQLVWKDSEWSVQSGYLQPGRGRPRNLKPLFSVLAEKLPFPALSKVRKEFAKTINFNGLHIKPLGVYLAHDSMGVTRYIGRGAIFSRLRARQRQNPLELRYFSFYVVAEKSHERQIETLLIRAGGPQLLFNSRKKRVDAKPGNVRDYEAGTWFFERQRKRGRKSSISPKR